jgi:hypothetical protein
MTTTLTIAALLTLSILGIPAMVALDVWDTRVSRG